jgi:MT0933-like antitoxin protein
MGILDKVKDWLGKNPQKAGDAINKAGDFVDKRTGGKYAQHVDKAQDAAKKAVDKSNPQTP